MNLTDVGVAAVLNGILANAGGVDQVGRGDLADARVERLADAVAVAFVGVGGDGGPWVTEIRWLAVS